MKDVAIVCSSGPGGAALIARRLAARLGELKITVRLIRAEDQRAALPASVDGVILGGDLPAGEIPRALAAWVRRQAAALERLPTALYLTDRTPGLEPLRAFMLRAGLAPDYVAAFDEKFIATNIDRQMSFLDAFLQHREASPFSVAQRFPEYLLVNRMKTFEHSWQGKVTIGAPPGAVYHALTVMPAAEARAAHLLGTLRTLGRESRQVWHETFATTADRFGNVALLEYPGRELVSGLIGRFWRLDFGIVKIRPEDFFRFSRPGYTKVLTVFRFVPALNRTTELWMEMRIHSTSTEARRKFALYWLVLGPGIRWYAWSLLHSLKRFAESPAGQRKSPAAEAV